MADNITKKEEAKDKDTEVTKETPVDASAKKITKTTAKPKSPKADSTEVKKEAPVDALADIPESIRKKLEQNKKRINARKKVKIRDMFRLVKLSLKLLTTIQLSLSLI
ncbi:MAG: hypothetical protein NT091_00270 [Candidatus Falkowbacteria bacterium]|nr:hypothetical protein [Candidatus Falkowbacteria bacterium]